MKSIAFFNNKGGVGKTTLVYHLGWMLNELGCNVLMMDLDPQANLTTMFFTDDEAEETLFSANAKISIYQAIKPLTKRVGDIKNPYIYKADDNLGLILGDLALSEVEDALSDAWPRSSDRDEGAFRLLSAIYRITKVAAEEMEADYVLIDVGPNLGALNRASLIAADYVITPMGPDVYSLQGLRNLGPKLNMWRAEWADRLNSRTPKDLDFELPQGKMLPVGYIVMQHVERAGRPIKSYGKWISRIPETYHEYLLSEPDLDDLSLENDKSCLARIKHFSSLMPMAMEARKPMFKLSSADGAFGSHAAAVRNCHKAFKKLANTVQSALKAEK